MSYATIKTFKEEEPREVPPTDQELMDYIEGISIEIVVLINKRTMAVEELERRLETQRLKER